MEQLGFHKQKLYALIAAGVGLIAMLMPWTRAAGMTVEKGFESWGFLSLAGIALVAFSAMQGNKANDFDASNKKLALAGFAAMVVGAAIFYFTRDSRLGLDAFDDLGFGGFGVSKKAKSILGTGMGLWLCAIAGLAGLGLVMGYIKTPATKPVSTNPPL